MNRSYSITVEAEIPKEGAEGVLYSMGVDDGGLTFYILDKSFITLTIMQQRNFFR